MPSHTYFGLPVTHYLQVLHDSQLSCPHLVFSPLGVSNHTYATRREFFWILTMCCAWCQHTHPCHVMYPATLGSRNPYYVLYRWGRDDWEGQGYCPSLYIYLETGQGFQPRSAWLPRLVLLTIIIYTVPRAIFISLVNLLWASPCTILPEK